MALANEWFDDGRGDSSLRDFAQFTPRCAA